MNTTNAAWQHAATHGGIQPNPTPTPASGEEFDHAHCRAQQAAATEDAYWRGYDQAEHDTHQQYQRWLGVAREHLTNSRPYIEMQAARAYTDQPCNTRCGHCSRCIRSSAATRNTAKYGTPDYPGAGQ